MNGLCLRQQALTVSHKTVSVPTCCPVLPFVHDLDVEQTQVILS